MKFVKYKPIWRDSKYMITPDEKIINSGGHITVGFYEQGPDGWNVARIDGQIDISNFTQFEMQELTAAEALEILREHDPDAEITEEGEFKMPGFYRVED
jgi:hypothetical protein